MPQDTVTEVLKEVEALPPEEKDHVREFLYGLLTLLAVGAAAHILEKTVSLLPDERRQLRDALSRDLMDMAGPEVRAEITRSVRGKYAHLPTSSEMFAAQKAEEIAIEDRRRAS